jgi:hypothetical protein
MVVITLYFVGVLELFSQLLAIFPGDAVNDTALVLKAMV